MTRGSHRRRWRSRRLRRHTPPAAPIPAGAVGNGPAWLSVHAQPDGSVLFFGSSPPTADGRAHPMLYGAPLAAVVVGSVMVSAQVAFGADRQRAPRVAAEKAARTVDLGEALRGGVLLVGSDEQVTIARECVLRQWWPFS